MHISWLILTMLVPGPGTIVQSCPIQEALCPGFCALSTALQAGPAGRAWQERPTLDNGTWSVERFEPLMGGRWVAEGVLSGGRRYTAERRYEWLMDRRFVRVHQRLTVDDVTVEEETTFGWDASAEALRMWSVASDGSFAEGAERAAPGENRWVFEGRTIGGRGGEWRTTTLLIDPGSFSVLLEVRANGSYEPAMTLAYRKVADPEDEG